MLDFDNGNKYGLCVKPQNTYELKEAISLMLNNKEYSTSCSENVKKRVKEMYSMPIIWEQMCKIWSN